MLKFDIKERIKLNDLEYTINDNNSKIIDNIFKNK